MIQCKTKLTAAAVLLTAGHGAAFAQVHKHIPANAISALWTSDFAAMNEGMQQTPYGKLINDDSMDQLGTALWEQMSADMSEQEQEALNDFGNFFSHLKGETAFYVILAEEEFNPDDPNMTAVFFSQLDEEGLAWIAENQPFEDMQDVEKDTYTVAGIEVRRTSGFLPDDEDLDVQIPALDNVDTPSGYDLTYHQAQVGDYYFMAEGEDQEAIKQAIASLSGAAELNHVGGGIPAEMASKFTSASGLNFFLDIDRILDLAVDSYSAEAPNFNTSKLVTALGLDSIQDLYYNIDSSGADMTNDIVITTGERTGLLKALSDAEPINMDSLEMAPADAYSVNLFAFDFSAFYDAAAQIAESLYPGSSAYPQIFLLQYQSQYGVNPLDGVLRNIAGTHLSYTRPLDPEAEQQLIAEGMPAVPGTTLFLGMRNGAQTASNLETLLEGLKKDPSIGGAINTEKDQGVTVVTSDTAAAALQAMQPALAFSSKAIAFTVIPSDMQEAIRALRGESAASITETEEFQKVRSALGSDEVLTMSYVSTAGVVNSFEGIQSSLALMQLPIDPALANFDTAVIKKYLGASYGTIRAADGYLHSNGVVKGRQ